jgi:hypothetical protein
MLIVVVWELRPVKNLVKLSCCCCFLTLKICRLPRRRVVHASKSTPFFFDTHLKTYLSDLNRLSTGHSTKYKENKHNKLAFVTKVVAEVGAAASVVVAARGLSQKDRLVEVPVKI